MLWGNVVVFVQKISVLGIAKCGRLCFNICEVKIMKCFFINLNSTPRVSLSSKEHLIPPRVHIARRALTYILYFVTDGELRIKLNGEDFAMNRGDVYIFEKGDVHAPTWATDCEYFYLHFEADARTDELSFEAMRSAADERNRAFSGFEFLDLRRYSHLYAILPQRMHVEDGEQFDALEEQFRSMRLNVWDTEAERRLEISQQAARIFMRLERLALTEVSALSSTSDRFQSTFVRQIASFIESNYTRDFGSEEIEKRFSLSYDYANRTFKRIRGRSIIAYRNHLRIEKAKLLLVTTDKSMEAIADEVGFGDKYYFSKFFKKTVGVSPTAFKRGTYAEN